MGDNLGNLSQDLDIFGAPEAVEDVPTELSVDDLFWPSDTKEEVAPEEVVEDTTPTEDKMLEEPIKDEVKKDEDVKSEEPKADEPGEKGNEDEEMQKFIDDLLADTTEVEDKVEEIKEVAADNWDSEMVKIVSELELLLAEKNSKIEEQWRQLEVTNNRFLEKVGEAENFGIYKDVIEKLEGDSKLMMLVKHKDTDNQKVKDRLVSVTTDILYDLTWQDVSELLDDKVKGDVATALGTPESNAPMTPTILPEEDDKEIDFEESINMLF